MKTRKRHVHLIREGSSARARAAFGGCGHEGIAISKSATLAAY